MFKFLKNREDLKEIVARASKDCTPAPNKIFRAMMPVEQIRVVIVGQDPYPQPGVATGRAFEVGGLTDWHTPFRQISLKNIVRLLYASETNANPYEYPYRRILQEMDEGHFWMLPPNRLFEYWQSEGVLLLNASLTCQVRMPGSHEELWSGLCRDLMHYVEDAVHPVWFLWGTSARKYAGFRNTCPSRHPMMCAPKWEDDFLKNPCFHQTASLVDWLGKEVRDV